MTFGSVINDRRFRAPLFDALRRNEEQYTRTVEAHFDRHLRLVRAVKNGVSGRDPALRGLWQCSHTAVYAPLAKVRAPWLTA